MIDLTRIQFDDNGLVPGIVQAPSGQVRMLGYLNAEAVRRTFETGLVTFFSRRRQALWTKGDTSGNSLRFIDMHLDCDGDSLLITANPNGPTCHQGGQTCFDGAKGGALQWLLGLEEVLKAKRATAAASGSYTQRLFFRGLDRIGKKVVEEAGEVILAAKNHQVDAACREALVGEVADLLAHLQMLLVERGVDLAEVVALLEARHASISEGC